MNTGNIMYTHGCALYIFQNMYVLYHIILYHIAMYTVKYNTHYNIHIPVNCHNCIVIACAAADTPLISNACVTLVIARKVIFNAIALNCTIAPALNRGIIEVNEGIWKTVLILSNSRLKSRYIYIIEEVISEIHVANAAPAIPMICNVYVYTLVILRLLYVYYICCMYILYMYIKYIQYGIVLTTQYYIYSIHSYTHMYDILRISHIIYSRLTYPY